MENSIFIPKGFMHTDDKAVKFVNLRIFLLVLAIALCVTKSIAQISELNSDDNPYSVRVLFNGSTSPKHFDNHYTVTPPEGYVLIDAENAHKFLVDYLGNPPQNVEGVLACILPDINNLYEEDIPYFFVIEDVMCGYVKDDDASSINYSDLLKEMKEDTRKSNAEYRKANPDYPIVSLIGWAETPYYDKDNHTLYWGKLLDFQNDVNTVNYDMRILGKDGIVCINAVGDETDLAELKRTGQQMLGNITFDKGFTYDDFDESKDHIAEWTIGGLVAGKILTKVGFWAILAKGWKFILIGLVAIGASIKKFFRKKDEDSAELQ